MRLVLAQLNFTVGAFEGNFAKISAAVAQAKAAEAGLVVFSEMAATGYPPRDLLNHPRFIDLNLALVDKVAALSTAQLGILIGFVDRNPSSDGKPLHNAVALCHGGRIVERRYKSLLPTYDVFDEDRYFEPARDVAPLALNGLNLGVTICEDVWNDKDFWPKRLLPSRSRLRASGPGRLALREHLRQPVQPQEGRIPSPDDPPEALKHGRYFFYLNQVGGNDELVFDGHSIGVDPEGRETSGRGTSTKTS
jgi:predicted amidohydrolase